MAKPKIKHTITKKEWNKKHKDFKLMGRDGIPYIMMYDDKIGTHLVPVKIIDESLDESAFSEIDILAKEAGNFKSFVKDFFKSFKDFPKNRDTTKWLEDLYKSAVSESVVTEGPMDRIFGGIPYTKKGKQSIVTMKLPDDVKKRIIQRAKKEGKVAKPNFGGGVTVFESVIDEVIDKDDLKNAKDRLNYPHTIEDIEYRKTSRGDKFVKIIYKKKYVPGKMMDTGPHFVSVFYEDEKDLQNIGKALKLKLKESVNEATPEEEDEFHRNLDKLVHKTFGHSSDEEKMNEANEPDIISQLRDIVSKKQNQKLKDPKSGKTMRVDLYSASAVTQVYDALKQQSNKDKFVSMGLVGMVNMAFKLINKQEIVEYDVETLEELNDFHQFMKEYKSDINEAEYQGRKVELGKIMQGDVKKFKVYVKNDKGNVVKVNFGQGGDAKGGTMRIRKNNPEARKSFRARHNCDNPGPRWKARYWSCRKW
jgi:hypothetical protein